MSLAQKTAKVFISSTSEDLLDYRAVARLVVLYIGWYPQMMEHFGALATLTVKACCEKLEECDLVLCIAAFRRGWVPTIEQGGNGQDSITALELAHARMKKIPVLALFARDNWPGNLWDHDPAAWAWIQRFRNEINLPVGWFDYEPPAARDAQAYPAFRALVRETLNKHYQDLLAKQGPASVLASPAQIARARQILRSGECVPFIGHGVYGEGPLSTNAILQALGDDDKPSLASFAENAEYLEPILGSRGNFVKRLETVILEQAPQTPVPTAYELLATIRPPLIVSATNDLKLEQFLEERSKQKVWILCHIIDSKNDVHNGKVLLFRGLDDKRPDLCLADTVKLTEAEESYVIYKPLGSPLLHGRLDHELGIDTVVATEGDHVTLFGRLEHQSSGLPDAFARILQRYPLVFLGYNLDVWQYRLVLRMLESVSDIGDPPRGLAIRAPTSALEEFTWADLHIDLLTMGLDDLLAKVGVQSMGQS